MAEEDLYQARRSKVEAIQARGDDPWPVRFDRTHLAAELQELFADLPAGSDSAKTVKIAGRLVSTRSQGKIAFGDVEDASGKIQLFIAEDLDEFEVLDSGDIVGAEGVVVRTKRGELSVRTGRVNLLAKALRPMPDKWHGLQDVERRYRERYLDLIANPDARRLAELRTEVVRVTRSFFDGRGFREVETPVLHPIPGGGFAQPFVTHFNAIDQDMYLRIATELYLKRLVIGGLERVYEIGRTFRNEGLSYKYNPEFTMLEAYQAYADYKDVMSIFEEFVVMVANETLGTTRSEFRGHVVELGSWRRATMHELVGEATGASIDPGTPVTTLRETCARFGVEVQPWWGAGMLVGQLYDKVAEKGIVEPTIVYDYPVETSPLARTHRDDPRLVERFEPVVCGTEIGNAFSELNDPIEQRGRFDAQMEARARGDLEAQQLDEPFIRALEYGMPPTGGLGVGIDRLTMVLGGANSIREVILFPALRPEGDDTDEGTSEA